MSEQNLSDKIKTLHIDDDKKTMNYNRKSKKNYWVIGIIVILVLAYAGYRLTNVPEISTVKVTLMKPPVIGESILTASGYVVPNHPILLSPKITGRVEWIGIDKGSLVKKGQELVRIEQSEYISQVNQAKARLASTKARLAELKNGAREEEKQISKATLSQAKSKSNNLEVTYHRMEKLFQDGAVSKESVDNASTQWMMAKDELRSAEQNVLMLNNGTRKEQIDQAAAEVMSAEAALNYAQTQLGDTIIKAPSDGTILERLIEVGEIVTNTNFGGTRGARSSLLSIANLKDLQIEIDLNEADFSKIVMHQPATIALEAYPDYLYKGTVVEIAPEANRQKATVQIKVQVLNPDEKIRPEMNAKVSFLNDVPPEQSTVQSRIYVPSTALFSDGNKKDFYVYVVVDNRLKKTPIVRGNETEYGVEILKGLQENQTLALKGTLTYKDGLKIKAK